jgi:hypothetical protein
LIYPLTLKAKEWREYVVEASSDPTEEPEDQECEDEEDEDEREDENDGDAEGEDSDYEFDWSIEQSWTGLLRAYSAAEYDAEYKGSGIITIARRSAD